MVAQAFIVNDIRSSNNPTETGGIPTVVPVTSGPLTITVKNAQGTIAMAPIHADLSQTSQVVSYPIDLSSLDQGTYTVLVEATINSTPLESHFTVANKIPSNLTGTSPDDLNFQGHYIIAVDSQGNANGGTLTVTRGSVVWSMPGFKIVKPDSTGTFEVTGPSGTPHTYTSPDPWARFIPVE